MAHQVKNKKARISTGTSFSERFEIVKELGRGSCGVVYLASDHEKGRDVALKVFAPSIGEFQNEVSVLSQLHNPYLVEIYDIGFDSDQKTYFLAEEYFEGEPLARWAGRLSFQRVAEITAHLCQVLQFLHQQGIFHGDLKPNNILINDNAENNIKLVDFGLAGRFLSMKDRPVESGIPGTISGTLPYIAPELFMGAPVSGRSDLYSLGATLYELVSGHPPFSGKEASTLIEKHLFEIPMNPIPAGSSIPKEFGFLILKLLLKDPSARFEEANDLIRALNLQFNFNFSLGPEKPVLSPELAHELEEKHVERLYEWAVPFYKDRQDMESQRLLAEIYYRQGKWEEAEKLLEGLTGPRVQLLRLQIGLKKGRFDWVLDEGKRLLKEPFKEEQRGLLVNTMGEALYYLGRYGEAEEAYREALSCFEKVGDQTSRAALLNNLGNLSLREEKWEEAKDYFEKSITLSCEIGDFQNEGISLMSLGYVAQLEKNLEQVIPYYQQSEAILEGIGYRPGMAKVKCKLANFLIATGSLEKGEEKMRQSEEIALEIGDRFLLAHSRLLAGDLLTKKGNISEAIAAYREGKRLFSELKSPYEEAIADKSLAEAEEKNIQPETPVIETAPLEAEKPVTSILQRIFEINRRISLLQDVDPILEAIIDSLIEFTAAERGYLILREEGKNKVKVTRGMEEKEGFSNSLVDQIFESGQPIVTFDAMSDERFSAVRSVQLLKLRSIICIPLHLREEVIGVLYLDNRLRTAVFTEADLPLLQSFADQAAIAISNAWVFEELKKSARDIAKLNEELQMALSEKEMELHQVRGSLASKQAALELKYRYDKIIGRSPLMMEALKLLDRVTESDIPVFLFGESGTGKELIARAIHFNGPRAKHPFVPLNCSAIPETLLEAEFFGYVRGAFTGAERNHEGIFANANKGTLFIDEIGDMPMAMQAKLLRVLEERIFKPLGSQKEVPVDVRILTASKRDLKELVSEKKFRDDLFFRIHGIRITLPPLRERKEDLPLLIDHYLKKWAREEGNGKKVLTRGAFELLAAYSWPGNIRELETTLGNACLLAEGTKIKVEDLKQKEELFIQEGSKEKNDDQESSLDASLKESEEKIIRETLQQCHGNVSQTAKNLKIPRPRLYRLIKKFGIQIAEFK